jgi:hypothetical protein
MNPHSRLKYGHEHFMDMYFLEKKLMLPFERASMAELAACLLLVPKNQDSNLSMTVKSLIMIYLPVPYFTPIFHGQFTE